MIQTELLDLKVGKLKSFPPLSLSFLHRQLVNIFCDCGVLLLFSLTSRQRYDYWKKKALSELSIPHIKKKPQNKCKFSHRQINHFSCRVFKQADKE